MQKMDFNDKVNGEHIAELHQRIESSAVTILSLESKVRDLSKTDVSVSERLKQVRDTAEGELKKFQIESDEQYNRNVSCRVVSLRFYRVFAKSPYTFFSFNRQIDMQNSMNTGVIW